MNNAPQFKRLVASMLEFATPAEEQAFTDYVILEVEHQRQLLGYEKDKVPRGGTLIDKWTRYQRMWEQDFSHRKKDGESIYAESNLSMNLPLTQISQHADKIGNDLTGSPSFFGTTTEGSEDQNPAIDVLKQRLLFRSKKVNLHEHGKRGTLGSLIRGQEILRPSYSEHVHMRPTRVTQTMVGNVVVKDSKGVPVTQELDKWITNPNDPTQTILERDSLVAYPIETVFTPGKASVVMRRIKGEVGCDVKPVHFADFFTVLNAESVDEAYIKGHAFRINAGDLVNSYDPTALTPQAKVYLDKHIAEQLAVSNENDYTVQANLTKPEKGEDDEMIESDTTYTGRHRKRAFYEVWIRYDANKDGHDEDIYCLIDINEKLAIHYEYASLILPWDESPHPHPYVTFRIWPNMHRWTGTGYYELLEVFADVVDRNLNRIEVDSGTSGNVVFENTQATVEGMDGGGIQFRTRMAYELRPGFTAKEALDVVTVEPANADIFKELMNEFERRVQVQGGITSPQDAESAGLPGTNTLGGLKIMEQTGNMGIRSREGEIVVGLTRLLHTFADIEIWSMLQDPTSLIKQVGPEKAQALIQWAQQNPGDWRNIFEVSLTKVNSSSMVENGQAILTVLKEWMGTPPGYKKLHQPAYRNILKGLDEPNPDILLNYKLSIEADMAAAAAQAEADQPTEQAA